MASRVPKRFLILKMHLKSHHLSSVKEAGRPKYPSTDVVSMITISKDESLSDIDTTWLEGEAQLLLHALGYDDFDLGIMLTTNNVIQDFSKRYRDINRPTDVLSFPYHLKLAAGQKITPASDEDKAIGDIIISLEYVAEHPMPDTSFQEHVRILLVHGLCHLLGYTHDTDAAYEIMSTKERELLELLANH